MVFINSRNASGRLLLKKGRVKSQITLSPFLSNYNTFRAPPLHPIRKKGNVNHVFKRLLKKHQNGDMNEMHFTKEIICAKIVNFQETIFMLSLKSLFNHINANFFFHIFDVFFSFSTLFCSAANAIFPGTDKNYFYNWSKLL